jgi:hypothetical protein
MNSVIEKIDLFELGNPTLVKLYPPVSESLIRSAEQQLDILLDPKLSEIYGHTNGFGIIDYCLLGLGNKRIGDLVGTNLGNWDIAIPALKGRYIEFIGTSGDESYGYLYQPGFTEFTVVSMGDIATGDYKVVSSTVEGFFEYFFDKLQLLFEYRKTNKWAMYIGDLP